MRILFFSSNRYPHIGGQSVHMAKLSDALTRLGHSVDILSASDVPPAAMLALTRSAAIIRILFGPWLWFVYYIYGLRALFALLVLRRARSEMYDVIHTQDPITAISASLWRGLLAGKVLLTVHGYFAYESVAGRAREGSFMWSFLQKWESTAYHKAELIFTVDEEIRRYIEGFDVDSQKIVALRNFVDIDEFSPASEGGRNRERFNLPEDKFLVLCPRRLVRKCGVIYAARAAKRLRERLGNEFVLVYTGEGIERDRITQYVEDNDLQDNVLLLGNIPHENMPTLFRAADAVVIPSVTVGVEREATSISALEAMASGVPVVVSDIGGLRELISTQENGYLVPERDAHALAEALFRIATEDQRALVENAREDIVSSYSHIERAKEYLSHYGAAQ